MSLAFRCVPSVVRPWAWAADRLRHHPGTHDSNRGLGPKMLPKPHGRVSPNWSRHGITTKPYAVCLSRILPFRVIVAVQPQRQAVDGPGPWVPTLKCAPDLTLRRDEKRRRLPFRGCECDSDAIWVNSRPRDVHHQTGLVRFWECHSHYDAWRSCQTMLISGPWCCFWRDGRDGLHLITRHSFQLPCLTCGVLAVIFIRSVLLWVIQFVTFNWTDGNWEREIVDGHGGRRKRTTAQGLNFTDRYLSRFMRGKVAARVRSQLLLYISFWYTTFAVPCMGAHHIWCRTNLHQPTPAGTNDNTHHIKAGNWKKK